ncbi:MAG: hypothetical protein ACTHK1_14630 [Actinomycetales bacterium]
MATGLDEQETLTRLAARVEEAEDALAQLAALRALHLAVQSRIEASVQDARGQQVSWAAIGDRLGCTRQAAAQRYTPSTPAASPPLAGGAAADGAPDDQAVIAVEAAEDRGRDVDATCPPPQGSRLAPESEPPSGRRGRPVGSQRSGGREEWMVTTPGGRLLLRATRTKASRGSREPLPPSTRRDRRAG